MLFLLAGAEDGAFDGIVLGGFCCCCPEAVGVAGLAAPCWEPLPLFPSLGFTAPLPPPTP